MKTTIVSDSCMEKGTALDRVLAAQIPPEWEKYAKAVLVITTVLLIFAAGWMGVLHRLFRIIPD